MRKIIAVALFSVAAVFAVPSVAARATPDINFVHDAALFCRDLDADHSIQGTFDATMRPIRQGIDEEYAASVIEYALLYVCSEYLDEWNAMYERYVGAAKRRLV